jgi:hypothetical protein
LSLLYGVKATVGGDGRDQVSLCKYSLERAGNGAAGDPSWWAWGNFEGMEAAVGR